MPVAVITGSSRGVGAATVLSLAGQGVDVVINCRNKRARAERIADQVRELGTRATVVEADLTDRDAADRLVDTAVGTFGRLDLLILNASGGLEADMPAEYAMQLNRDAQLRLADRAAAAMPDGGRIVFVTSHEAHFYGTGETLPSYAPVAASKQAGERALLDRADSYAARGISLIVVSGDLIDGTITATLLDRVRPGLIEQRREQAGKLPTVDEFAAEIAAAALDGAPDKIIFVGSVSTEEQ